MNNSPEEIEALKSRAFRPPEVDLSEDIKFILRFAFLSIFIYLALYLVIGYTYVILIQNGNWIIFKEFILTLSFGATIVFGVLRTLRYSMAQIASDPFMVFPMRAKNVTGHLRDLIKMTTSLEWDLTGLIGSSTTLLIFYYIF